MNVTSKVLRIFVWGVVVVVGLGVVLGALFAYFVYSPAPEVPRLSGKLTLGSIEVNGLRRTYRTYVPRGLANGAPLVLVLHGAGENGSHMRIEAGYGFDRLADAHGFAVVYPNAYDGYWNVCTVAEEVWSNGRSVDDIGFLTAMVDKLVREMGVDPSRVFAAGSSRGGFMAFRLALEAPSRFRAVAAVSANVPSPENFKCRPAGRGTPSVLIMNGTEDPLVPFDGGSVSLFGLFYRLGKVRSSRESAQYFADLNHITGTPETHRRQLAGGVRVEEVLWRNHSNVEVELVAVHGGGHGIPQPYRRRPRLLGPSATEPNGPAVIWDFFARQRGPLPLLERRLSNETQRYVNHRVSALDPLLYLAPGGRHRPGHGAGNAHQPQRGAHFCLLVVRNAGARRTSIGLHHHAPRRALFVGGPPRSHEGEGRRRHEQPRPLQRTLLFRLDADRDRRDRALLGRSLGARTVEFAWRRSR